MEDIAYGEPARTRRCERSNDEPLREVKAVRRAVEQVKAEVGAEFALMKESLRQLQLDRADSGSSGSESSPAEPPTASRLDRPLPSPGSSKLSRNGKVQNLFNGVARRCNERAPANERIDMLSDAMLKRGSASA